MPKILFYKKLGETPLEAVGRFKLENPEYKSVKTAYAGRLDPMAEGQLLLLIGDECKKREMYQKLDKKYEFEVLFGLETDSYDVLGLIKNKLTYSSTELEKNQILQVAQSFVGKFWQKYPPYSSARVAGKPLFYWARNNKLSEIEIPTKQVQIYFLDFIENYRLSIGKIFEIVNKRISLVKGNFRQQEILNSWKYLVNANQGQIFNIYKFTISCSSGTYIRSIANEMGKKLKTKAIAFGIKRIEVKIQSH